MDSNLYRWEPKALSVCTPVDTLQRTEKDLHLMRYCRHHIIANSSFNWWAAWLSGGESTLVVAPQNWFAEVERGVAPTLPQNWIAL